MDMPMPSGRKQEVEVITGVQRRRRWTPEQKLEGVRRTTEPGMSVSLVALGANEPVAPACELQDAMRRIR
jgi:transposase